MVVTLEEEQPVLEIILEVMQDCAQLGSLLTDALATRAAKKGRRRIDFIVTRLRWVRCTRRFI
jgi:hypothetical protein